MQPKFFGQQAGLHQADVDQAEDGVDGQARLQRERSLPKLCVGEGGDLVTSRTCASEARVSLPFVSGSRR